MVNNQLAMHYWFRKESVNILLQSTTDPKWMTYLFTTVTLQLTGIQNGSNSHWLQGNILFCAKLHVTKKEDPAVASNGVVIPGFRRVTYALDTDTSLASWVPVVLSAICRKITNERRGYSRTREKTESAEKKAPGRSSGKNRYQYGERTLRVTSSKPILCRNCSSSLLSLLGSWMQKINKIQKL